MTPLSLSRELLGRYTEALQAYLREGQSSILSRARELGQTALMSGIGVVGICGIHHESLRQLRARFAPGGNGPDDRPAGDGLLPVLASRDSGLDPLAAAGAFLGESLTALEAEQLAIRRANMVLRRHTRLLEDDLRNVSRIVYDEAMQLLSAARLALAGADREPPAVVWGLLDRIEEQLASCPDRARPRVLEDLGLASAVHCLARRFSADYQLAVETEAAIGPVRPEVGIALYRSVLEALTNVRRHARASRVRIRLCEECSVIHCSIRDDGIGFDMAKALSEAEELGSGFVAIQESLRGIGGSMVVDSAPGQGTELRIAVGPRLAE